MDYIFVKNSTSGLIGQVKDMDPNAVQTQQLVAKGIMVEAGESKQLEPKLETKPAGPSEIKEPAKAPKKRKPAKKVEGEGDA